ncbi:MAG: class IV adenylate cyclase [Ignavibacteria bacterium]|nr:class IV adenylate cyclase [Ignavibacteria bacterium]
MPANLELKAHYTSAEDASAIAAKFIKNEPELLLQVDTYFDVRDGRLKLREFGLDDAELIYYHRSNQRTERISEYSTIPIHDVEGVKQLLSGRLGLKTVVDKRRLVFLYENARIHIDIVKDLGTFIEFEVMVTRGRRQAHRLMHQLREKFEIRDDQLVGPSYSDLLIAKAPTVISTLNPETH